MILSIVSTPRVDAEAAGRAFAAALDGAELHGEARHLGHVDRVVEDDNAAMADEPVLRRESLVVEGRVEKAGGK